MVIDAKLLPKDSDEQSVPQPPPSYPSASEAQPYPPLSPVSGSSPPLSVPITPTHTSYPQPIYTGSPGQYPSPAAYINIGAQYQHQLFAKCAQGDHDVTTTFGLCGIICAVLLFPFGLVCLCMDSEKKCARCGARVD
ncbi:hypothetical protein K488DRAFT_82546 [Vararia minispora EC-137]|uniref:Uncharacterized protein n=1 Tax=Vararia minispora EC-137 TaxID=1314806 RepID=A0ACB8QVK4_9AGAM|nr:hypothetical protein K488DRAFT_82546 [Vararia minispora EC-137]